MTSLLEHFISEASSIIPFRMLIKWNRLPFVCPFYHTVSNSEVKHIKYLYPVKNANEFKADLDFLLKHYQPISYGQLTAHIENRIPLHKKSLLLSFDDGLSEFYSIIAPILLERGIPAICFINTDFVDNKDLFYRYKVSLLINELMVQQLSTEQRNKINTWQAKHKINIIADCKNLMEVQYEQRQSLDELAGILKFSFKDYLHKQKPYLCSEQINELKEQGFAFGAHSCNHPLYPQLTLDEQIAQTRKSIDYITTNYGMQQRLFSFPFTDTGVSMQFFDTIFSADSPIADLTFGTSGIKHDRVKRNVQRIPFENGTKGAKEILQNEYFYYIIKSLFNKNTINRQ